jgi:predicted nuclease of predicted toxin-antitoxin system
MRFHVDEHISRGLVLGLRSHGHDVTTPSDVGLSEAGDQPHVEFTLREDRVIITHDRDFLVKHAQGTRHAGILYCHQQKYSIGQLLTMCLLVADCYTQEEMRGRVEFL